MVPYQLFHYLKCKVVDNSILALISAFVCLAIKRQTSIVKTLQSLFKMSGNLSQIEVAGVCFIPLRLEGA